MSHARPASRRRLLGLATATALTAGTAGTGGAGGAAAQNSPAAGPADALNRSAHPLDDLDALGRMVGGARIVGLGEASHSGHEFFTLKQRVFRHLVATKGFITFALEASWSTGLRLDAYVTRGVGDPAQIMGDEFQGQYVFWNTQEHLDLIDWMRRYNVAHPDRPQLYFVGNDLGFPGRTAFDQISGYLAQYRPDLTADIAASYASLRPEADTEAGPRMANQLYARSATERKADADEAATAPCAAARPRAPVRSRQVQPRGVRLGGAERHRHRPELHRLCLPRRAVLRADALSRPGHGHQRRLVAASPRRQDPARLEQRPHRLRQ